MTEHPIIFSGPSIRAILEGRKTQTRRVVKYDFPLDVEDIFYWDAPNLPAHAKAKEGLYYRCPQGLRFAMKCPYGIPGDRLWAREAWRIGSWDENTGGIMVDYRAGNSARRKWLTIPDDVGGYQFNNYWIESCEDCAKAGVKPGRDEKYHWRPGHSPCRWRSPIYMPRWASRLTLDVVNIRLQRLQEISIDDAIAEGVFANFYPPDGHGFRSEAQNLYRDYWDSINAKRGYGWATNPMVWVVEFERAA